LAVGCWPLAVGMLSLIFFVSGCWLLAVGLWHIISSLRTFPSSSNYLIIKPSHHLSHTNLVIFQFFNSFRNLAHPEASGRNPHFPHFS
jgi:hypothetical protein